jgi:hypothetical protein
VSAPPTVAISNRINDGDSPRVQLWKALDRGQVKVRPGGYLAGHVYGRRDVEKEIQVREKGQSGALIKSRNRRLLNVELLVV